MPPQLTGYDGLKLQIPMSFVGLSFPRNDLSVPFIFMEDIRNVNLHEGGVGRRGGSAVLDTMAGSAKVTGLKQFISKLGDDWLLRATGDGSLWKDSSTTIKTGLSVRGDEVLAERDLATHAKWNVTGDWDDTGGNLSYTFVSAQGIALQGSSNFEVPVKPNKIYEFKYTVGNRTDSPGAHINEDIASADTDLDLSSNGVKTTQFTTNAAPGNFVIQVPNASGTDAFTLDDLSLKEVIAPPVDISVYNDNAIFTNGRDVPQVFTGLRFLEAPAACVAGNANIGVGLLDSNVYTYKITLTNTSGETTGSPASNPVDVTWAVVDGQVKLTSIPVGSSEITSRKIYRTEGGGSIYKLLDTISDNTTTVYIDNIADGSLGAVIPTDNTATTGAATTDLGAEGLAIPEALTATLVGASAPTAVLAGSGTGVTVGTHSWMVVFIGAGDVHSTYGSKSNVVTVPGGGEDVSLTDVAIGPTGTVKREIFRTVAGDAGEYYEVGEIADNTTTTFTDAVADAALGSNIINNGVLTAGADWTFGGDFASAVNLARYTHSTGSGNLIQATPNLAKIAENNHRYEVEYEVVANSAPANISVFRLEAGQLTDDNVALDKSVGVHTATVTTKTSGFVAFNITIASGGAVVMDIDNIFVREVASAGVPINAGTHSYKTTFINVHGESTAGTISNVITADALNGEVSLTDIPIGPTGVIARRIYRTEAGGSTYLLLSTLPDNVTTTYKDFIADATLIDPEPTSNEAAARPSDWIGNNQPLFAVEHAAINNEGIIFAGFPDKPWDFTMVRDGSNDFSQANVRELTITSRDRDDIHGLVGGIEIGSRPFLLSRKAAWLVDKTSTNIDEWTYFRAPWSGGTMNNKTLVKVESDVHIMSAIGDVYSATAVQEFGDFKAASLMRPSTNRPQDVYRWVRENVDLDKGDQFHGEYDEDLGAVFWWIVRSGQTVSDTALVYFKFLDRWVIHDNRVNDSGYTAMSSTVVNVNGVRAIYTGDDVGRVWKLNQSNQNDDSAAFSSLIKTHRMIPLREENDFLATYSFDRVFLISEPIAAQNYTVDTWVDGTPLSQETVSMATRYSNYQPGKSGKDIQIQVKSMEIDKDFFLKAVGIYMQRLGYPPE